jgi:hypothetical protein
MKSQENPAFFGDNRGYLYKLAKICYNYTYNTVGEGQCLLFGKLAERVFMVKQSKPQSQGLEALSLKFTNWVGSTSSLVVHTILFIGSFCLYFFGIPFDTILLAVTTIVSLEAIYLAIFIQMTVNRNTQSLAEVEEDIDEIQEDVEGIEKDIDEIQEDVEGMEKDIDEIQEDEIEDDKHDEHTMRTLTEIQTNLVRLMGDIETLKQEKQEKK